MAPLRLGVDAEVSVLYRYVHPSQVVRELFPNMLSGERIKKCIVLRQEMKKINRRDQMAVVFKSPSFFGDQELYCVRRWLNVEREGREDQLFDVSEDDDAEEEAEEPELVEVAERANGGQPVTDEELTKLVGQVEVDDDNVPAPENRPEAGNTANVMEEEWGHNGMCFRRTAGATNNQPKLPNIPRDTQPSLVKLFEILFPVGFIKRVMIPMMNRELSPPIDYGEFLRWLGIWFLMATIQGPQRRDFWSTAEVSAFDSAPFRCSEYMSRNRFENILRALKFTDRAPPTFKDRFWEVRDILKAWVDNMKENFVAGWVNCLDESMSVWTNLFTCPGFMYVPRKPWPFGNEYHTICCGICGVLFDLEIVEGKDRPDELPQPEFDRHGKTVGLLVRLTKSLWGTGKLVILDSGFCVVKGLVELKRKGVFASALIKKRRYWPKYIDGDAIKSHFEGAEVGSADALRGSVDNIDFHVFAMKEPDYTMMLMSTYGTNNREAGKETKRQWKDDNGNRCEATFRYPEVVHNHYKYRHFIDDHNAKRHQPISLEVIWATSRWACRVFAFLLGVTEVNVFLCDNFFFDAQHSCMLGFRKLFARSLIYNEYYEGEKPPSSSTRKRKHRCGAHELITIPAFRKFRADGKLVECQTKHNQRKCQCGKRTRTYCKCSPGIHLCNECYVDHRLEDSS